MSERNLRRFDPDDDPLARELRSLGEHISFPSAPDISEAVVDRIRLRSSEPTRFDSRLRSRRILLASVAVAAAILLVIVISPLRNAAADLFGVPGISISFRGDDPTSTAIPDAPLNSLGTVVSQADLISNIDFTPLVADPVRFGEPDQFFFQQLPNGEVAIHMVYEPSETFPRTAETGTGLLLTEIETDAHISYFVKGVFESGTVTRFILDGSEAFWVEGTSELLILNGDGTANPRPSANVLIWFTDGITIRMESALDFDSAVAVAESLTPISIEGHND